MTALKDLLAATENGAGWGNLPRPPELHTDLCWKAFEGSLDAAKALHDAVLPGWDLQICTYEDDLFEVSVSLPFCVKTYDGLSEIIARAWLIALLRALIAQKKSA